MTPLLQYAAQWGLAALGARSRIARTISAAARDYPEWRDSRAAGRAALPEAVPWITFGAARFLDSVIRRDWKIFEYGSGGSTLYLAGRAGQLVSIEHDPAWADKVRVELERRNLGRCELRCIEPERAASPADPSDPEGAASSWHGLRDFSFARYAAAIDAAEDASLDLVLVDGRARPACVAHARPKVKPGGYLLLDNSDRPHYAKAAAALGAWKRFDFHGPGPYVLAFFCSTFWQRPGVS
jgi:predicted O-methyltransferase YrrM